MRNMVFDLLPFPIQAVLVIFSTDARPARTPKRILTFYGSVTRSHPRICLLGVLTATHRGAWLV